VLYGRYTAIVFSLIIHLVIIVVVSLTSPSIPKQVIIDKSIIKSYLYKAPIIKDLPPIKKEEIKTEEIVKKTEKDKTKAESQQKTVKEVKAESTQAITLKENRAPLDKETAKTIEKKIIKSDAPLKSPSVAKVKNRFSNFNPLQQLENLRSDIYEKKLAEDIADIQQFRSASIMTGKQIPVPHSEVQKSAEQKKVENTTNYGDGKKIINNHNGTCTVESDLSAVGIEGVTAIEGFACGESQFNKSFRLHMKALRKKLGK